MSASNFLNREFKRALKDAGLPAVTAHSLRHSFASILKSAGIAPSVAHEIIGHSNFGTTMKLYGSVSSEARLLAAATVGDAMRGGMDKHQTNN
jgi:integrase